MMAGVTVVAWYPITPSSSLCESLIGYMKKYRMDKETGKATFAIVQAEDEIASLGMVIGASWAGARSMTATAGPGISLMSEFTGLAYYAETPAVIFDVQRVGPSTGLPTRTAQGDLLSTAFLSHGDTKHIMLHPVLRRGVLRDGDGGVRPRRAVPDADVRDDRPRPRHEQLDVRAVSSIRTSRSTAARCSPPRSSRSSATWGRYKDVDGDGIPYRTIPGDGMPSYFTRGSGHNAKAQYSERPDDYVDNMDRLARKFETARKFVPEARRRKRRPDAKIGIIAYGTTHWAITESRDQLREETDVKTSYYRLRAYPFNDALNEFIDAHERVYVVEQNRDAQMRQLMKLELTPERCAKLRSVLHYSGLPIDARSVTDDVLSQEGFEVAKKTVHVTEVAGGGMTGGE